MHTDEALTILLSLLKDTVLLFKSQHLPHTKRIRHIQLLFPGHVDSLTVIQVENGIHSKSNTQNRGGVQSPLWKRKAQRVGQI